MSLLRGRTFGCDRVVPVRQLSRIGDCRAAAIVGIAVLRQKVGGAPIERDALGGRLKGAADSIDSYRVARERVPLCEWDRGAVCDGALEIFQDRRMAKH